MRAELEAQLSKKLDAKLVTELLDAHSEAKRNFYLGGLRLSAVEGGRFCEAAFRLLESVAFGSPSPLGKQLDTEKTIERLRNVNSTTFPDAIRLHIPRAL